MGVDERQVPAKVQPMGDLRDLLLGGNRGFSNRQRRGFPWFRVGVLLVAGGLVGILFTSIPGKIKRGLRELRVPKTVAIAADEADLRRQIESSLRAEMEEKLEMELAAISKAAEAAAMGAEATKTMKAKYGRARNLGDRVIGHADPGAVSVSLIFKGFCEGISI